MLRKVNNGGSRFCGLTPPALPCALPIESELGAKWGGVGGMGGDTVPSAHLPNNLSEFNCPQPVDKPVDNYCSQQSPKLLSPCI